MSSFDLFLPILLKHEGSTFIPDDNGRGPSKFGITAKTLTDDWKGDKIDDLPSFIQALTPTAASDIYREYLWNRYHFGLIEDQTLANHVADFAANAGPSASIMCLQKGVNAISGRLFVIQPLEVDGVLGSRTAEVVNGQLPSRVLAEFLDQAYNHYILVVTAHPEWRGDLNGWVNRLHDPDLTTKS